MREIVCNWELRNYSGWGLVALNLFFQWANDPAVRPLIAKPILESKLQFNDPLRTLAVLDGIIASNEYCERIASGAQAGYAQNAIVLQPHGNQLQSPQPINGGVQVSRCIFEDTDLRPHVHQLEFADHLLAGSTWNAQLLSEASGRPVKVIFEGVDPSLFVPGPKSGVLSADHFYVFSGGKVEYRKGHDLVLRAFRQFQSMHPEAVLVTAWHSPWPELSAGFQGTLQAPLTIGPNGQLDIHGWVARNGIPPKSVIDLGKLTNPMLPSILREMDVALTASRAEACSCLPMLEAMASGVPVIAPTNAGLADVVSTENALPLTHLTPITGRDYGTDGWCDADVDKIVAHLEHAYQHRADAQRLGLAGREWLIAHQRTWQDHARLLKEWLLTL